MQLPQIYDISRPSPQWTEFKFEADSSHPLMCLINSVCEQYSVQLELRVKTHQPWWEHQIKHAKFTVEAVPELSAGAAAADAKKRSLEQQQQQKALQQQRDKLQKELAEIAQSLKAAELSKAELQAKLEESSSEVGLQMKSSKGIGSHLIAGVEA
jgi:flagellar motility protein MotE (MotC chaperone)